MKCTPIVFAALAALSLSAFGQAQDDAAAAQRAKLVTSVQAKLGVQPVDGKIGPRTHQAIEQFQRSKGLEASGQLDKKTVTALGPPSTPIGPAQPSEERAAEPMIKPAVPTGETK